MATSNSNVECGVCDREFGSERGRSIHQTKMHGDGAPDIDPVEAIRDLADGEEPPTLREMSENGAYSQDIYEAEFGSWTSALEAAGFDPSREAHNRVSTRRLLDELRRLAAEYGAPVTSVEMDEHGRYSSAAYLRRFGGWVAAQEEAGVETTRAEHGVGKSELKTELRRVADKLVRTPTAREIDSHGSYSSVLYERRFGSWSEALRAGGLELLRQPPGEGKHAKYLGSWRSARNKAAIRDQARCQDCGISGAEHAKEHGQGLDVHHKVPYSEFESPEEAHSLDNLVALCRPCHRARHSNSE